MINLLFYGFYWLYPICAVPLLIYLMKYFTEGKKYIAIIFAIYSFTFIAIIWISRVFLF